MSKTQLLVLAAGMGSRFGGLKQMEGVGPGGEVLLEYSFYDAWRAGIRDVVVLLRWGMEEAFEEKIGCHWRDRLNLQFAFQEVDLPGGPEGRTKPWGTGHAVLSAAPQIDSPFLVINADDYYGVQAFAQGGEFLRERVRPDHYALVGFRLVQTLQGKLPVSRGICQCSPEGSLLDIVECPYVDAGPAGGWVGGVSAEKAAPLAADLWTSVNFWAFHPSVMALLQKKFDQFWERDRQSPKAEFYLPSAIGEAIQEAAITVHLEPQEGAWLGMTYLEDRDLVRDGLQRAHRAGDYPSTLR